MRTPPTPRPRSTRQAASAMAIPGRTRAAVDLGLPLRTQLSVYYAVVVWAVLAALAMYAFTRTPVGRMCNAVRDNPERAEFVGYSTQRVRFIAFAAAGLFAGLAGGLHAINYEIVAADAVSAQRSGTVLIMAYIGGGGAPPCAC